MRIRTQHSSITGGPGNTTARELTALRGHGTVRAVYTGNLSALLNFLSLLICLPVDGKTPFGQGRLCVTGEGVGGNTHTKLIFLLPVISHSQHRSPAAAAGSVLHVATLSLSSDLNHCGSGGIGWGSAEKKIGGLLVAPQRKLQHLLLCWNGTHSLRSLTRSNTQTGMLAGL